MPVKSHPQAPTLPSSTREKTSSITSYLIQELGHPEALDLGRWLLDLKQRLTLNLDQVKENWNNIWHGSPPVPDVHFASLQLTGHI